MNAVVAGQVLTETGPIETPENENPQVVETPPVEAPVRRGPGRPKGSGKKVVEQAPNASATPIQIQSDKRGPGRPPGSGKAASPKKAVDAKALANQLKFFHAAAARLTRLEDLEIDNDEAEMLADSIATLMREYDIALSGKTAALLGIVGAMGMVYGPRFIMIREQVQRRKAAQAKEN